MSGSPVIFIVLAFFTLAILIVGVVIMAKGGKINKKLSNKLMIMRVALQALTLIALAVLFFFIGK